MGEEQAEVKDRSGITRQYNLTSIPASGILLPPAPSGLISNFMCINRSAATAVGQNIVNVSCEQDLDYPSPGTPVDSFGGAWGWAPKNCTQIKLTTMGATGLSVHVVVNLDPEEAPE